MPSTTLACYHLREARLFSSVELWTAIVAHEDKATKRAREARKAERERQEQERNRHAQHEDFAQIEGEAEGFMDDPPRVRREYVIRPAPKLPPQADQGAAGVKGSRRRQP